MFFFFFFAFTSTSNSHHKSRHHGPALNCSLRELLQLLMQLRQFLTKIDTDNKQNQPKRVIAARKITKTQRASFPHNLPHIRFSVVSSSPAQWRIPVHHSLMPHFGCHLTQCELMPYFVEEPPKRVHPSLL